MAWFAGAVCDPPPYKDTDIIAAARQPVLHSSLVLRNRRKEQRPHMRAPGEENGSGPCVTCFHLACVSCLTRGQRRGNKNDVPACHNKWCAVVAGERYNRCPFSFGSAVPLHSSYSSTACCNFRTRDIQEPVGKEEAFQKPLACDLAR